MKSYFPFTDYDFYAYLASGSGFLFALDYALTGGAIAFQDDWSFIEILLVVAVAYATGHISAGISSPVLEHWLARSFLLPPIAVLTGLKQPRWRERVVARLVGRYYDPFSAKIRTSLLSKTASSLSVGVDAITDPEDVFQAAFPVARQSDDTRRRMDDFRNQYGFCRNLALVGIVGAILIGVRAYLLCDQTALIVSGLTSALGIGMLVRFLKFYSSYAAEVLRAFAFNSTAE